MPGMNLDLRVLVLGLVAALSLFPIPMAHANATCQSTVQVIPQAAINGSVTTEFISNNAPVDAPKQSGFNSSTWDWWYFDVVSSDASQAFVILFNLGVGTALEGVSPSVVPWCSITGTLSNGTGYAYNTFATNGAVVTTTSDQASQGNWLGAGVSWVGSSDMQEYHLILDTPEVTGTVTFNSTAPAHYPCGPIAPCSNLEIGPNIGWANAVPDAISTVDLLVSGSNVTYTGVGYHDKVRQDIIASLSYNSAFSFFLPLTFMWPELGNSSIPHRLH